MRTTTKAAMAGGALGLGFAILRAYQKKTPTAETIKRAVTVTASTAAAGAVVGAVLEATPHVKKTASAVKSGSAMMRWAEVAAAAMPLIQTMSEFVGTTPQEEARRTEAPKANTGAGAAKEKKKSAKQQYVFLNGSLGKVRLATTMLNKARGRRSVFSMFGPLRTRTARFGRR